MLCGWQNERKGADRKTDKLSEKPNGVSERGRKLPNGTEKTGDNREGVPAKARKTGK